MDDVGGHHTFFPISLFFLFSFFFFKLNPIFLSENRRLAIINSDQHFRKGSQYFRVWKKTMFHATVGRICVCMCVYISFKI